MAKAKPEVLYKTVEGFPNYRVGSDGSLWSRSRGGPRSTPPDAPFRRIATGHGRRSSNKRMKVRISNDRVAMDIPLDELILATFVGPRPEGHEAIHKNGDRADDRLDNLCWAVAEGPRRAPPPDSKLDPIKVRKIRKMLASRNSMPLIARLFGVSVGTIKDIKLGRTWRWVTEQGLDGKKPALNRGAVSAST
jgi:hypothetical protein